MSLSSGGQALQKETLGYKPSTVRLTTQTPLLLSPGREFIGLQILLLRVTLWSVPWVRTPSLIVHDSGDDSPP